MTPIRCPNASSSAKLFVQLSLRQHQWHPPRPAHLLDLLAPAAASAHYHTGATTGRCRHPRSPRTSLLPAAPSRVVASVAAPQRRIRFSTTAPRRRTQTLYNPQQDEDGKEMMLEITPRAAKVPTYLPLLFTPIHPRLFSIPQRGERALRSLSLLAPFLSIRLHHPAIHKTF